MILFLSDPFTYSNYFLLAFAIIGLWLFKDLRIQMSLIAIATGDALFSHLLGRPGISLIGIVFEVMLGLLCYSFFQLKLRPMHRFGHGVMIVIATIALGFHKIPGFYNWLVLRNVSLTPDAIPINFYLNFDKPLFGFFIVAFGIETIRSWKEWRKVFVKIIPIAGLACLTLLGLSFALGYVKFEPKWFSYSFDWLFFNLVFTCVVEEAFFRGFLQNQVSQLLSRGSFRSTAASTTAWIFVSILFGLVHLPGGWTYVFLSSIAGLFYGFAFIKTNRLEASILTHFIVNAIHFVFFTYPALLPR